MNVRNLIGIALMILGLFVFFYQGDPFGASQIFTYFWPSLFVLPLGLFFHWLYFSMFDRRWPGVLVPGGILLITGAVCQVSMLFDIWQYTWPGFLLAVAFGLFELYWFGYRNRWLLVPVVVLVVLAGLFFFAMSVGSVLDFFHGRPILAASLIIVGALLLMGRRKKAQS